ncbi:dihydroxyacetone kinase phosphoryl donor subunit DhaM [Pseudoramibacter alactolyticus]|uniref:dihydroxyacetone kinase phosphoryl donor subunit DhaM n=1 Tax=Pseudoramibacter alactolyticus TaxID=113287 RepID=UPI0028E50481|nr:dihydroxyacetone kinase phosphoryl donor subunit DhaM [Pseudoramibacter alactolyticus]
MATGILIVSHSEKLAEGIVELISEMANDSVVIKQAGGTEDGRLGTDAVRVQAAIESMADCGAILIYCDLGSSIISSEMAIEMLDDDALREKVQIVDCPIVEGAFTGVVQASLTEDVAEIVAVSEQARELRKQS